MSFLRASAVKQTTQTLGTSNLVLLPNDGDTRSFQDQLGVGPKKCRYMFRGPGYFQQGRGTFTAPDQLTRDEVIKSSNNDAEVPIPSGTTDVYLLDYAHFVIDRFSTTKTLTNKDASQSWVYTGSGAADLNLPANATVLPDFWGFVKAVGSGTLTLKANGSDTIDESGSSSLGIKTGESGFVFWDEAGSIWRFARTGSAPAGQIQGTATNDDAAAGKVGEFLSQSVAGGLWTTATYVPLVYVDLTPGDWDVRGYGCAEPNNSGNYLTNFVLFVSSGGASWPGPANARGVYRPYSSAATEYVADNVAPVRFKVASGTVRVYLYGYITVGAGSFGKFATIEARRVR
jgi:hypothetical protein